MKHRISQIDGLDDCTEDEITANEEPPPLPKGNTKANSALCYKNMYGTCGGHATQNEHTKWHDNVKASCPFPHTWHTSSCTVAEL